MENVNLGSKIRELRKKKGITQDTLANALLVSPQAVSKWGKRDRSAGHRAHPRHSKLLRRDDGRTI